MDEQKEHNQLDQHFHDAFAEMEVTPPPMVWEKVEKVLDADGRKRPGAWWLLGIGLFVLLGVAAWFYWLQPMVQEKKTANNVNPAVKHSPTQTPASPEGRQRQDTQKEKQRSETESDDKDKLKESGETGTREKTQQDEAILTDENQKQGKKTEAGERKKETAESLPGESSHVKTSLNERANRHGEVEAKGKSKPTDESGIRNKQKSDDGSVETGRTESNRETIASSGNSATKPITNTKNQPVDMASNTVLSSGTPAQTADNTAKEKASATPKTENPPSSPLTVQAEPGATATQKADSSRLLAKTPDHATGIHPLSADSATAAKGDSLAKKKASDTLQALLSHIPDFTPAPTDSLKGLSFSLSGFSSPEVYMNRIRSYNGSFDVKSERTNPRFNSGARFGVCFKDKLEVNVGCSYSQINQEFHAETLLFPKNISQPFVFNSSLGDMSVPVSTMLSSFNMLAPVTDFKCKYQYTQTVQFIIIPVTARLNFRHGRWGGYISAGLNLQYAFSQQATLELVKENETDRINYNSLDVRKVNYAAVLGLGAEFRISKQISVFLEPNARMNLLPVTNSSAVQSSASFYGAGGGVRWNL